MDILNWNKVLRYIKLKLASPTGFIEFTDDQFIEYIKLSTIPEFSKYFPDKEYASILLNDPKCRVQSQSNRFYFFDDQDLPVYDIIECYFPMDGGLTLPYVGVYNIGSLCPWALQVFNTKMFLKYSDFDYTYNYIPPNIIHIISDANLIGQGFMVEYEREQPHDLTRIHGSLAKDFMDFCLADVMTWIGEQRSYYGDGTITTPLGEIPLRGAEIKSAGEDKKAALLEKFEENALPPITFTIL